MPYALVTHPAFADTWILGDLAIPQNYVSFLRLQNLQCRTHLLHFAYTGRLCSHLRVRPFQGEGTVVLHFFGIGSSKHWPVFVWVLNAREQSRRLPRRDLIISHVTSRFNSGCFRSTSPGGAFAFLEPQPRPLKNPIKGMRLFRQKICQPKILLIPPDLCTESS